MLTALVTGANRGLGFEAARQLLAQGYRVYVSARRREDAERAVSELGSDAALAAELDVEQPVSVERLAATLHAQRVAIDALVNNAGASFDGFDERIAARTLDINYRGPERVTRALTPLLSAQANVVMVSSGMGELSSFSAELRARLLVEQLSRSELEQLAHEFVDAVRARRVEAAGFPRNAYSVSKALLNGLTRVLARELSPLRVNAVCPGWVKTRMGGASAPRSLEVGARGIVWAATLGADGASGGFFRDAKRLAW